MSTEENCAAEISATLSSQREIASKIKQCVSCIRKTSPDDRTPANRSIQEQSLAQLGKQLAEYHKLLVEVLSPDHPYITEDEYEMFCDTIVVGLERLKSWPTDNAHTSSMTPGPARALAGPSVPPNVSPAATHPGLGLPQPTTNASEASSAQVFKSEHPQNPGSPAREAEPAVAHLVLNTPDGGHRTISVPLPSSAQGVPFVFNINVPSAETSPRANSSTPKLAPISIDPFGGDWGSWLQFIGLFESMIHNNASLAPMVKFQYLINSLKGDAKKTIEHIDVAEYNYETAFQLLKANYHNERRICDDQVNKLINLKQMQPHSAAGIFEILSTLNVALNVLNKFKFETDSWAPVIANLVLGKLDEDSRTRFEEYTSESFQVPTIDEVKKFLNQRYRVLLVKSASRSEDGECRDSVLAIAETTVNTQSSRKSPSQQEKRRSAKNNRPCYSCQSTEHGIRNCPWFLNMAPTERMRRVQETGLCLNCFGRHQDRCPAQGNCKLCTQSHNSLLHGGSPQVEGRTTTPGRTPEPLRQSHSFATTCTRVEPAPHEVDPAQVFAKVPSRDETSFIAAGYSSQHDPLDPFQDQAGPSVPPNVSTVASYSNLVSLQKTTHADAASSQLLHLALPFPSVRPLTEAAEQSVGHPTMGTPPQTTDVDGASSSQDSNPEQPTGPLSSKEVPEAPLPAQAEYHQPSQRKPPEDQKRDQQFSNDQRHVCHRTEQNFSARRTTDLVNQTQILATISPLGATTQNWSLENPPTMWVKNSTRRDPSTAVIRPPQQLEESARGFLSLAPPVPASLDATLLQQQQTGDNPVAGPDECSSGTAEGHANARNNELGEREQLASATAGTGKGGPLIHHLDFPRFSYQQSSKLRNVAGPASDSPDHHRILQPEMDTANARAVLQSIVEAVGHSDERSKDKMLQVVERSSFDNTVNEQRIAPPKAVPSPPSTPDPTHLGKKGGEHISLETVETLRDYEIRINDDSRSSVIQFTGGMQTDAPHGSATQFSGAHLPRHVIWSLPLDGFQDRPGPEPPPRQ